TKTKIGSVYIICSEIPYSVECRNRTVCRKKLRIYRLAGAEQVGLQLIAERQRAALLADKLKQLGISIE
ncbi:MAG TPA: hypothetical protein DCQ37_05805, partial [Desulfobacteraceae bacterium]|nr:hypothetical protein [Desulfobacteraceae bacterium]